MAYQRGGAMPPECRPLGPPARLRGLLGPAGEQRRDAQAEAAQDHSRGRCGGHAAQQEHMPRLGHLELGLEQNIVGILLQAAHGLEVGLILRGRSPAQYAAGDSQQRQPKEEPGS